MMRAPRMSLDLLTDNLTNPPVLFFVVGLLVTLFRSNLEFPDPLPKLFSYYLLFAIGFKGGVGLAHTTPSWYAGGILLVAVVSAMVIPVYTFFGIRAFFKPADAAAIGATYGSVSAVTFITASTFLDGVGDPYGGYMVAALALMESPSVIVGLLLAQRFARTHSEVNMNMKAMLHEALFNGSVFLLLASLAVGWISTEEGHKAVQPMTGGMFYGALCIFLLDMGISASRRMGELRANLVPALAVGIGLPILNAAIAITICRVGGVPVGDGLLLTVLMASASYIAVPAVLRHSLPDANPGLYVPMALAITFPLNISIGIPVYYYLLGGTGNITP